MYVIELRASDAIMGAADEPRPDSLTMKCTEFVQLTYNELRSGPEGTSLAYFDEHTDAWRLTHDDALSWSDIIITCDEEKHAKA